MTAPPELSDADERGMAILAAVVVIGGMGLFFAVGFLTAMLLYA